MCVRAKSRLSIEMWSVKWYVNMEMEVFLQSTSQARRILECIHRFVQDLTLRWCQRRSPCFISNAHTNNGH